MWKCFRKEEKSPFCTGTCHGCGEEMVMNFGFQQGMVMDVAMSMCHLSQAKMRTGSQDGYTYILTWTARQQVIGIMSWSLNTMAVSLWNLSMVNTWCKGTKCHLHASAICRGDIMDVRTSIWNPAHSTCFSGSASKYCAGIKFNGELWKTTTANWERSQEAGPCKKKRWPST